MHKTDIGPFQEIYLNIKNNIQSISNISAQDFWEHNLNHTSAPNYLYN